MPSANWLTAAQKTPCEPVMYAVFESAGGIGQQQKLASEWNAGTKTSVEVASLPGGGGAVQLANYQQSFYATGDKQYTVGAITVANGSYIHALNGRLRGSGSIYDQAPVTEATAYVRLSTGPTGLHVYAHPITVPLLITGTNPNAKTLWVDDIMTRITFPPGSYLMPGYTYEIFVTFVVSALSTTATLNGIVMSRDSFTPYLPENPNTYAELQYATGSFLSLGMDMGIIGTTDSRVYLDDIASGGSSITYTMEGSNDNSNWTPLGTVVDGRSVPPYRYYRLSASLQGTGQNMPELRIWRMSGGNTQYQHIGTHINEPADIVGNIKPYLKNVSTLSSKIALRDKPTLGDLTLTLQWLKETSELVATPARWRAITVYIGFKGLAAADYEPYFTGTWEGYTADKDRREFSIKVRDIWKRFKKKIPDQQISNGIRQPLEYQFGRSPSGIGTALNIIDAMIQIMDIAKVPDRYIDRPAFAALQAGNFTDSGWNVFRILTDQKDSEDLLNDLAVTAGVFLVPQPNGKLLPKHYDTIQQQAPAATFDAGQIQFSEINPDGAQTVTRQMIYHNIQRDDKGKYLTGEDKNDFASLYTTIDHPACITAERDRDEIIEMEWFDKWGMGSGLAAGVATPLTKLAARFESWYTPIANIDGIDVATNLINIRASNVPLRYYGIMPGDAVMIDNLRLPCPASAWEGFSNQVKFLVLSKAVDTKNFTLTFDLLQIAPLSYNTTPTWYNYSQSELYPPVSGLTLSERLTRGIDGAVQTWLDIAFTVPTDSFNSAEIWSNTAGTGWQHIGTVHGGGPTTRRDFSLAVKDGQSVQIAILTVNAANRRMALADAPQATRIVIGKNFPPGPPLAVTASVERNLIRISITPPLDADLASYIIRLGSTYDSGTDIGVIAYPQDTFLWSPNTAGDLQFWVKSKDTTNHLSTTATSATLTINAPQFPGGTAIIPQVIDNNVLLKWSAAAGTYPVDSYEIRKGQDFATAATLGNITGTFNTFFETVSGTYKYWVVAKDINGLYGTPLATYATVSQPPDFVLRDQRASNPTWSGTKNNCTIDSDGTLLCLVNPTETWEEHFKNLAPYTFSRTGVAYQQDGTQVADGVPRYEEGRFGQAIMVEEGTTNLLTANQASIATDLTGINTYNATNVRDTVVKREGVASLKTTLTTTNGGGGPYMSTIVGSVSQGDAITASVYVTGLIARSFRLAIEWKSSGGGVISSSVGVSTPLTSEWNRLTVTGVAPALASLATITLYSTNSGSVGDILWSDCWQVEKKAYPTSWTVGTRNPETLTIPTAGSLNLSEGTIECWVYNSQADNTNPRSIFMHRSAVYKDYVVLQRNGSSWQFMLSNNAATDHVQGPNRRELNIADSTAVGWVHLAATWSATEMALYINGVKEAAYASPPLPSAMNAVCHMGSWYDAGSLPWNSLIDDLRISDRSRSEAEILTSYESAIPLVKDVDTTIKLSFDASAQDQIDAGLPLFIQPGVGSGYYEEVVDYAASLSGTRITMDITRDDPLIGQVAITPKISTSPNGSDWTDYSDLYQVYVANFRYVKYRLDFSSSDGGILRVIDIQTKLDLKIKTIQGEAAVNSADSGGTSIDITGQFIDIQAITLTPKGTTAMFAIYDYVDTPNPTNFKALLFNTTGSRLSGTVSYTIRGV